MRRIVQSTRGHGGLCGCCYLNFAAGTDNHGEFTLSGNGEPDSPLQRSRVRLRPPGDAPSPYCERTVAPSGQNRHIPVYAGHDGIRHGSCDAHAGRRVSNRSTCATSFLHQKQADTALLKPAGPGCQEQMRRHIATDQHYRLSVRFRGSDDGHTSSATTCPFFLCQSPSPPL